jgi:hypothetical protein
VDIKKCVKQSKFWSEKIMLRKHLNTYVIDDFKMDLQETRIENEAAHNKVKFLGIINEPSSSKTSEIRLSNRTFTNCQGKSA